MTTIAYRDGVVAADTQADRGGIYRVVKKLHRVGNDVIAFSGNYQDGLTFIDWWREGHDMKNLPEFRSYRDNDVPDFNALVVCPGVTVVQWTEYFQPMPVDDEFFAMGSGMAAATAAMVMGADARRAVEVASLVDINTGGAIDVVNVKADTIAVVGGLMCR